MNLKPLRSKYPKQRNKTRKKGPILKELWKTRQIAKLKKNIKEFSTPNWKKVMKKW